VDEPRRSSVRLWRPRRPVRRRPARRRGGTSTLQPDAIRHPSSPCAHGPRHPSNSVRPETRYWYEPLFGGSNAAVEHLQIVTDEPMHGPTQPAQIAGARARICLLCPHLVTCADLNTG
jgi:hypothetical protein